MSESYKNKILFDNLINRLQLNEETGNFDLLGVITKDERNALIAAQNLVKSEDYKISDTTSSTPNLTPTPSKSEHENPKDYLPEIVADVKKEQNDIVEDIITSKGLETLLDTSVIYPKEFNSNVKLGLDFVTAYSNACMLHTLDGEEKILDLPLGIYAG